MRSGTPSPRLTRGRGLGGLIVELFCFWLAGQGVIDVDASVSPDNEPSLRLLRRRNFVETGEHWDEEDGRELILTKRVGWREPEEEKRRRLEAPRKSVARPIRTFEDLKERILFRAWLGFESVEELGVLSEIEVPGVEAGEGLARAVQELLDDGLLRLYEDTFDAVRELAGDEVPSVVDLLRMRPVPLAPYAVSSTEAGDLLARDLDL